MVGWWGGGVVVVWGLRGEEGEFYWSRYEALACSGTGVFPMKSS